MNAADHEPGKQNKQKEDLIVKQTKLKREREMGEVNLELAKLQYETDYLEMVVKQAQSKEYLKSCNSLFKHNSTLVASREKLQIQ